MKNAVEKISSGEFPFDIEGINGGLQGFFIAELAQSRLAELTRVKEAQKELTKAMRCVK